MVIRKNNQPTGILALIVALMLFSQMHFLHAQDGTLVARERQHYNVKEVPLPDSVILEVGGLAFTDDGKLGVATRRGEIWLIDDPYQKKSSRPTFKKFASGLHEPLGLAYRNGSFFATQRSEVTKITDVNQDGKADLYQTVTSWPLSGNYHEYSYGPLFTPEGNMLVNLNLSWVGRGESLTKWRGWMLKIHPNGMQEPYAAGLRSPAGFAYNSNGDLFFAENQGDWIPTGYITHIEKGSFAGHPASLRWAGEKNSPITDLKRSQFPDSIGSQLEFSKISKHFQLPAVIFPHTLMGISTCALLSINTDAFGPFKGQLLVGDQGHSKIMRAYLEKVNGKYQGACFPFLEGFASGILRLEWGVDQTLFVGMTSRGWAATGKALYGLQRVNWKGSVPFEIKSMRATPNGFIVDFTKPVNKKLAADLAQYKMAGFTYSYHRKYGSPILDQKECPVLRADVSENALSVRIYVGGLRAGFVHQLTIPNLQSSEGEKLIHAVGYYTLNSIPVASPLDKGIMSELEHGSHATRATSGKNSGCGPSSTKNITAQPAAWSKPDVTIQVGTKPGLKFDIESFSVPAGAKVKLIFNNNDDMLHNWVLTKPGKGDDVGKAAMNMGLRGSELAYVPESGDVLFNTCILQPESSQAIYFIAPPVGEYPYICSFPGHYMAMKGTMKVRP